MQPPRVWAALDRFRALPSVFDVDGSGLRHACRFEPPATRAEIRAASMSDAPMELLQVWEYARQAELYVDVDYGQWGVRLLSPAGSAELTREESRRRRGSYAPGDVVFGECIGDSELFVLRADGCVTVAMPMDPRPDWPTAANSISEFLDAYRHADGSWFWDPASPRTLP